ncbi:MAG: hypothetical protein EBU93_01785 [Chlamydiae bacterium]|nr:hypothetical protein [Chlamydiota bacterium]
MKKTCLFLIVSICLIIRPCGFLFAYTPQPGDTLDIQILNKKELNTRQLIAPDGTISLPFIGRTKVDGKSLDALDAQLKTEFAKYIQNPAIVIQVDQLKKPDSKTDNYFVSLANSDTGTIEVKTAKTLAEAMAWTAGKPFQTYRVNAVGQKTMLNPDEKLIPGDILVVDIVKSKPEPIYLAFYDQGKNLIDLKKAQTSSEAMGWTAGKSYQLVKRNEATQNMTVIESGDTLIVTIGKPDDWLGDNWYKILTGAAVVVGLFNSLR